MENILNQSPDGTTIEDIEKLFVKYDGNTNDILCELWNISSSNVVKNTYRDANYDQRQKWATIRDICNTYEEEMQKYMDSLRQK